MTLETANKQINNTISKLEKSLENHKYLLQLLNCDEVKAILPKLRIDIQNIGCILEVWQKDKGDYKYYTSFNRSAVIILDDKGIHVYLQKEGRTLKRLHPFTIYDCIKYLKAIADGKDVALI